MRQLTLGISPAPQPSLENFVPGPNAELLARLREFRDGSYPQVVLYLCGEPGSGKTHLMQACGGIDDVEKLDEAAQIELFNRINEARQAGGRVLAAGNAPPAQLPLREDLRTRLAWGLVYQLKALADDDRADYLRGEAERRGMRFADEVIWYLLTHVRRDLPSLLDIMEHLDRTSLELKRPITLPLVREVLSAIEQNQ